MNTHTLRASPSKVAVLATTLLLTACGSPAYKMQVQVDPRSASLFINGEEVEGGGDQSIRDLSFARCGRVTIQAAAPRYAPKCVRFTPEDLEEMIAHGLPITLTLQPR